MLRLTGGVFRGRMIQTPTDHRTRPTQAKLRQALFNSLQAHIPEARVLDLFAGSGALGFEALSRGANEVIFVEMARPALKLIEKNAETLKVRDRIQIVSDTMDVFATKLKQMGPFDLILADPPYEAGWEMKLLTTWPWENLLSPQGRFCLEWGVLKSAVVELPEQVPFLVKIREKNYGDSVLTTYSRDGL